MTVRITAAELASDVYAVLEKVRRGSEVIVEMANHQPVAVISRAPNPSGRPLDEIVRDAEERNCTVTLDEDFGKDMEEIIASHQRIWERPSWD